MSPLPGWRGACLCLTGGSVSERQVFLKSHLIATREDPNSFLVFSFLVCPLF